MPNGSMMHVSKFQVFELEYLMLKLFPFVFLLSTDTRADYKYDYLRVDSV
jgi:hypothetical protein